MSLFNDYTLRWWQMGLFKVSLISLGIIVGITWFDWFDLRDGVYLLLWVLFVIPAIYLIIALWPLRKQN